MISFLLGFIAGMITILVVAALAVLNEGARRG